MTARLMMARRFTSSDGREWPWNGPSDGNLFDEGFPSEIEDAIRSGAVVTDHLEGVEYRQQGDGQIRVTLSES